MKKPLVLIIEDDKDVAELFNHVIEPLGFETEVVRRGDIALSRLASIVPAVVLLDLHLPEVSGKDILRQIRADERLAETRVIVITAHSHMSDILQDEADLVLLKPVSVDQLSDLVLRLQPDDPSSGG